MQASCCCKLITESGNTLSTNNKPKTVYVLPTIHKEKVLNAVVLKALLFTITYKKLSSPLNGMSNCIIQRVS